MSLPLSSVPTDNNIDDIFRMIWLPASSPPNTGLPGRLCWELGLLLPRMQAESELCRCRLLLGWADRLRSVALWVWDSTCRYVDV